MDVTPVYPATMEEMLQQFPKKKLTGITQLGAISPVSIAALQGCPALTVVVRNRQPGKGCALDIPSLRMDGAAQPLHFELCVLSFE